MLNGLELRDASAGAEDDAFRTSASSDATEVVPGARAEINTSSFIIEVLKSHLTYEAIRCPNPNRNHVL